MFYHPIAYTTIMLWGDNMENLLNKQIGQRIREKREYIGLSREKFSEMIGISPQFLAEIEGGKKGMSSSTLYKMCVGLSTSADYIVLGREKENDISGIAEILRNLDAESLPFAEDIIKSFAIALSKSKTI
jgi:transcriptional regulator with XRE-family HTH domain